MSAGRLGLGARRTSKLAAAGSPRLWGVDEAREAARWLERTGRLWGDGREASTKRTRPHVMHARGEMAEDGGEIVPVASTKRMMRHAGTAHRSAPRAAHLGCG